MTFLQNKFLFVCSHSPARKVSIIFKLDFNRSHYIKIQFNQLFLTVTLCNDRPFSPDTYTDAEIAADQQDLPQDPHTRTNDPEDYSEAPIPNTPARLAPLTPSEIKIGQTRHRVSTIAIKDSVSNSDKIIYT